MIDPCSMAARHADLPVARQVLHAVHHGGALVGKHDVHVVRRAGHVVSAHMRLAISLGCHAAPGGAVGCWRCHPHGVACIGAGFRSHDLVGARRRSVATDEARLRIDHRDLPAVEQRSSGQSGHFEQRGPLAFSFRHYFAPRSGRVRSVFSGFLGSWPASPGAILNADARLRPVRPNRIAAEDTPLVITPSRPAGLYGNPRDQVLRRAGFSASPPSEREIDQPPHMLRKQSHANLSRHQPADCRGNSRLELNFSQTREGGLL